MSPRTAWIVVLLLALAAPAVAATPAFIAEASAAQLTACEEDGRSNEADDADEVQPAPEPARVILPCSLAEHAFVSPNNGDPSCADATIYVVTDAGVLLCQIDVAALASSSTLLIERSPPASFATSTAFAAAGIPAFGSALSPPLFVDLVAVCPATRALPRDGFARPPSVPS